MAESESNSSDYFPENAEIPLHFYEFVRHRQLPNIAQKMQSLDSDAIVVDTDISHKEVYKPGIYSFTEETGEEPPLERMLEIAIPGYLAAIDSEEDQHSEHRDGELFS